MSSTMTLLELRTKVRALGDTGGDSTTGRYTNARINKLVNDSWQQARDIAVTSGDGQLFLRSTGPTTMAAGTWDATSSFGAIRWPANAIQIHGIDIVPEGLVTDPAASCGGRGVVSLVPFSWGDRNFFSNHGFGGVGGQCTGRPVGFCIMDVGEEVNCNVASGHIAIFPAPDHEYTYKIWFIPTWDDRTEDDHIFLGLGGSFFEWVAWNCVIALAAGDNDMQNVLQVAMAERDKAEALMTVRVNRMQRVGASQRRDIAGQNRASFLTGRWGWRR